MPGPGDHCLLGGVSSPSTWPSAANSIATSLCQLWGKSQPETRRKIERRDETSKVDIHLLMEVGAVNGDRSPVIVQVSLSFAERGFKALSLLSYPVAWRTLVRQSPVCSCVC